MRNKLAFLLLLIILSATACKKSKTKKMIAGTWEVAAMYTDEGDLLLLKRKGKLLPIGCDTIAFERQEQLKSSIVFEENGNYTRTNNITITYIDTAASRLQCLAVYADSLINATETGTWRFEGKETLELIASNKNYEGNKLIAISNDAMEWQTDLTVAQGFVIFKGLRTTKFIQH